MQSIYSSNPIPQYHQQCAFQTPKMLGLCTAENALFNVYSSSWSQSLRAARIGHIDGRFCSRESWCGGWENAESAVRFLVYGDVVRKSPKEIHLAFYPAENLFWGS